MANSFPSNLADAHVNLNNNQVAVSEAFIPFILSDRPSAGSVLGLKCIYSTSSFQDLIEHSFNDGDIQYP
jgi:hypothetical protein